PPSPFFFKTPAPSHIYPLSLHDALPISFAAVIDANNGADRIAIGFRAGEMQPQRSVSGTDIVAKKIGRPVVGGEKQIHVAVAIEDRKSTRLNSSHRTISYAVFCLKKKKK